MSSNRNLQRKADAWKTRALPIDSARVVKQGDLVFQTADDIRAASSFTYVSGSLPQTQANFRRDFMGVALEAHTASDPAGFLSVAQAGVFEFDVASATFEVGDRVGPDDNAGATALEDQQVIGLGRSGGYGQIGTIVKRGTTKTKALVEITPQILQPLLPMFIPLTVLSTTTSGNLVVAWVCHFPFKLVAIHVTPTVAYTGTDVLTITKNAQALDDTVSATGAIGAVIRTVMDDATGDDQFNAGDTLTVATDGASTSGTALIFAEVLPFCHED